MKVWTAHTRPLSAPVLVREAFSWGALLFGPVWLLAHRAWLPALLALCAAIALAVLPPPAMRGPLLLALAWGQGLYGRDMLRWSLARRGFLLAHVIAATDTDAALARLLYRRPDLIEDAVR